MIDHQLETVRLKLVSVNPKLIKHLFETKSKQEIISFFETDETGLKSYEEMFEKGMETHQLSFLYFLLIHKQLGKIIGECGFHTWNKKHSKAEVFYSLREEEFKRKGYMSEALKKVIQFGFEAMQLHRITAMIGESNEASQKLVKKYGFVNEGLMRQDYFIEGKYEDSVCFSLLKSEWKSGTQL
jgi:ribosomal-protein-alanine N-acetyltransferase